MRNYLKIIWYSLVILIECWFILWILNEMLVRPIIELITRSL